MLQLTTKEFDIYKNYIFEKIAENFKHIGVIDTDYLKTVTKIEYEVSEITGLIYPSINFRDSFEKLETLSKIELNDKPNDLLEKYKIETVKVPILCIYSKNKIILNPYDYINNFPDYIQKCLDTIKPYSYVLHFEYDDFTILTNGEQKEFEFIDEDRNSKNIYYQSIIKPTVQLNYMNTIVIQKIKSEILLIQSNQLTQPNCKNWSSNITKMSKERKKKICNLQPPLKTN